MQTSQEIVTENTHKLIWTDCHNGNKGEGQPTSYAIAKSWADEMNRKYPHIVHVVVEKEFVHN